MIEWRFSADNDALRTEVGEREHGVIRTKRSSPGWALFGPYVDFPPGECTARVNLQGDRRGHALIEITAQEGRHILASREVDLSSLADGALEISGRIDAPVSQCEIRVRVDGDAELGITGLEIDLEPDKSQPIEPDRPVGFESRKTYAEKIASGFIEKYLSGSSVIEIGYKGYIGGTVPIVPHAIGIDIGYPGYDGITLPFADGSVDAIYSSHCFEHIADYVAVLRDWYRLLKVGGHMVIVVPHQYLFEKRRAPPSPSNPDHKRFYTPESLCREIGEALDENSYRIRHLAENDRGFNYQDLPRDPSYGLYEIECVIEKIEKPFWNLDDGTVRAYSASEFSTNLPRSDPWSIEIDFSETDRWLIWGPYLSLAPARYQVDFHFEPLALDAPLASPLMFDVSCDTISADSVTLDGEPGRAALARGIITVPFAAAGTAGFYEFRIHATGKPFARSLKFKGAVLLYERPQ